MAMDAKHCSNYLETVQIRLTSELKNRPKTYRMFIVTAAISIRLTFYLQTITGLSGLMVSASPRFDTHTTDILEQTKKQNKTQAHSLTRNVTFETAAILEFTD